MRILGVYAEDFPWDVRVEKILGGLAGDGHDVSLVCRNLERRPLRERVGTLECRRVLTPRLGHPLQSILSVPAYLNPVWRRAVREGIAETGADLVIVRDLPLAPAAIGEAHRAGVPCIVDMAENHPEMWRQVCLNDRWKLPSLVMKNPALAKRIEVGIARQADCIFVVVDEMKAHLVSIGADPRRVVVVSNTPPKADAGERTGPSAPTERGPVGDALEMIYTGFVTNRRGLAQVVDALALLGDTDRPARLNVIGQGAYLEELRKRARRLGVESRLVCRGWVDHRELPALIAAHDVGLIPHPRNGHTDNTVPNKIFDYMAAGLPVLVSDARPLARITTDLDCGLVFTDGNAAEIAERIRTFSDPVLRSRMGRNGREAVRTRYNWEADYGRAREAVDRLVPDRGRRTAP